jgi:hypothetical protein
MIGLALVVIGALVLDLAMAGTVGLPALELLGQVVVALLAWYLLYRHFKRSRELERSLHTPDPKDWTGKGFDASGISPRIAEVRKNYLPEKPAPQSHFHRGLLAFARVAVSRLGFFHERSHAEGQNASSHGQ